MKKDSFFKAVLLAQLVLLIMLIIAVWISGIEVEAKSISPEPLMRMRKGLTIKYETYELPNEQKDFELLSAAMELENGNGSDECLYLTGSVILNRRDYCSWCPNTIEEVLLQKGQYATRTVRNLYKVKPTERTQRIALQLLVCGTDTPHELVYQAMFKQGKLYKELNGEFFGLE